MMGCPVQLLSHLHRDLVDRGRRLAALPESERRGPVRELRAWFQVHCLLEETVLYPATLDLRSDEVVEAELDDLDCQKRLLGELCDLVDSAAPPPPGRSFEVLLSEFRQRLERHVDGEENGFYPRVRRLLDSDQKQDLSLQLSALVERARRRFAGEVADRGMPGEGDDDLDRLLGADWLVPPPPC